MSAFSKPEDIGNRAVQHCRGDRFSTFADFNVSAQEAGFVYDKLREAELRRRFWRFAIRRSILRSIDATSVSWTPPAWDVATTFAVGAVVLSGGEWWQSKVAGNVGNTPTPGDLWQRYFGPDYMEPFTAGALVFSAGELTTLGGTVYLSLIDNNSDTPPSANWLAVNGTITAIQILYPISTGPRSDVITANVFRLPHGYLRRAPSDPKAGMYQTVGVAYGPRAEDWTFEGNYIISRDIGPLMLRFVANMVDVPDMDPMFCEALAARIATEIAPRVAPPDFISGAISNSRAHYRSEVSEAGIVNGIEQGAVSPWVDDWIKVRL